MIDKRFSSINFIVTTLFLCFFTIFPQNLYADPEKPEIYRKVVKVGFYEMQGAQEIDAQGNLKGFYYDYLQAIMQYSNWDLQFITNCGWDDCMEMLLTGEIDILCGVQKNQERNKYYEFSEASARIFYSSLFVDKNNKKIPYNDFESFNGLTVGLIQGSARTENFFKFCKKNNFSMTPIYFSSETEMFNALKEGKIDTAMSSSNSNTNDFRIISDFDPQPQYIALKKGNYELLTELNQTLIKLNAENPSFDENLYRKHYMPSTGTNITFTKEEINFIENNNTFKILYDPKWKPLESYDSNKNEPKGAIIEILKLISKKTGLNFEFFSTGSYAENIELINRNHEYILSSVAYDYKWANNHNIHLTRPFIETTLSYVFKDDLNTNIFAIPESYYTNQYIFEKYPNSIIKTYSCIEECLDAVNSGEAEATILNIYELNYFLAEPKYHNLRFSNIPYLTESFSIGISKDAHPLLFSIINKTLNSISEEEIANAIKNNTQKEINDSFLDLIYTNPLDFFLIIFALFLLIVIVIILFAFTIINKKKNKAIKESFKVKFNFLSRMSHDLRTPLNTILGYLELAKNNISNTQLMENYLEKINYSSSFLLGLVNDCLDIGKNYNDKFILHPSPYVYKDFENSILAMIYPLCRQKNINFIVKPDKYPDAILVDKIRFEQIFFNLLTNAVKFTPEGGTIEFSFKNKSVCNGIFSCDFYVIDTGIGISQEFQDKMFLPFEQEANDVGIMSQGSGLGLSIVKNIVDLMEGTITVQSEKGKGTIFIIHLDLPIVDINKNNNSNYSDIEKVNLDDNQITIDKLKGKKVLLIEDHPMNIEIVKELLEKKEMSILCVTNGKEGLEVFENSNENEIDLILTDIRMPIMDGQEMTEKIRQLNRTDAKTIPIIAITANILDNDIKLYHKSGINDFVEKPIKPEVLYKVLRNSLNEKRD